MQLIHFPVQLRSDLGCRVKARAERCGAVDSALHSVAWKRAALYTRGCGSKELVSALSTRGFCRHMRRDRTPHVGDTGTLGRGQHDVATCVDRWRAHGSGRPLERTGRRRLCISTS